MYKTKSAAQEGPWVRSEAWCGPGERGRMNLVLVKPLLHDFHPLRCSCLPYDDDDISHLRLLGTRYNLYNVFKHLSEMEVDSH